MSMPWLFGEETLWAHGLTMQPRAIDVDVVKDIYRMMQETYLRDVELASRPPEILAQTEEETTRQRAAHAANLERVLGTLPKIKLVHRSEMDAAPATIDLDALSNLGAHERRQLVLEGAGLRVDFRAGSASPYTSDPAFDTRGLTRRVRTLIEKEGRRRPQWRRLLWTVPVFLVAIWTAAAIWLILTEPLAPAAITFLLVGLVIAWGGVCLLSPRIARNQRQTSIGHHIREVSRSVLRERLTNTRANVIISLITIPVGAVLGYFLRLWFGE